MMALASILVLLYASVLWPLLPYLKMRQSMPPESEPTIGFSIIVPFRNESKNLPDLLASFAKLEYPGHLFEVIFIDDASTDASAEVIESFPFTFLYRIMPNERRTHSPKKDAILTGLSKASFNWIATTDADCEVPPGWLRLLEREARSGREMLAAPVFYKSPDGFLSHFQLAEMLALQAMTLATFQKGKPFMCNGANFAYSKPFFETLGGFMGNEKYAGGDDVFLLQKAAASQIEKVGFLPYKQAIVLTQAEKTLWDVLQQRIRWAAKSSGYQSRYGKRLAVAVLGGNIAVLLGYFVMVLALMDLRPLIVGGIGLLCVAFKSAIDYAFMKRASSIFGQRLKSFLAGNLLYPLFSLVVTIGVLMGGFNWKGRKFRR